jgi:hypothetical protein
VPTELALVRSSKSGKAICFAVNRFILQRALRLGFTSLYAHADGRPVLYTAENRDLVALPLAKEAIVAENAKATRLLSTNEASTPQAPVANEPTVPKQARNNKPERTPAETISQFPETSTSASKHEEPATQATESNGSTPQEANGIAALIDEAESLKELLRDGYTRAHGLIAAAKRYRKQSKLVQSSLKALQELQHIAA